MKTTMILSVGILIIAFGGALAAGPPASATQPSPQNPDSSRLQPQITALQVSPMYLEIKDVLEQSALAEKGLLEALAAAADEQEVQQIVDQIKLMDLERDLEILRIQARYAHQEQRWSLEKQIRHRIVELEEGSLLAAR